MKRDWFMVAFHTYLLVTVAAGAGVFLACVLR